MTLSDYGTLRSPQPFQAKYWEEWAEEFKRIRRANKLHKEDGDIQGDSLLYAMGMNQAVQIMETFKWETEDDCDTNFDVLMGKFENFLPKRNLIHDPSVFNQRAQHEGESIEEFVRALNSLVDHCGYVDPKE